MGTLPERCQGSRKGKGPRCPEDKLAAPPPPGAFMDAEPSADNTARVGHAALLVASLPQARRRMLRSGNPFAD